MEKSRTLLGCSENAFLLLLKEKKSLIWNLAYLKIKVLNSREYMLMNLCDFFKRNRNYINQC